MKFGSGKVVYILRQGHILLEKGGQKMQEKNRELSWNLKEDLWEKFQKIWAWEGLQEVQLRIGQPVYILQNGVEKRLKEQNKESVIVTQQDLNQVLLHLCKYSVYAYEGERKQGFITLQGGHRLGIAGDVIMKNGVVEDFAHISSIHFRVATQKKGLAEPFAPFCYKDGIPVSIMVIAPPGVGKTTLLRDLARMYSTGTEYGAGVSVTVVDERSEIGGAYQGVAQNDLGPRTDLLDGCEKTVGILMSLRSLSPAVIVVDEIGSRQELDALQKVNCSGVSVLMSVHGKDLKEVKKRFEAHPFFENSMHRYIVIQKNRVQKRRYTMYSKEEQLLWQVEES